jgi:hypothetical protein
MLLKVYFNYLEHPFASLQVMWAIKLLAVALSLNFPIFLQIFQIVFMLGKTWGTP